MNPARKALDKQAQDINLDDVTRMVESLKAMHDTALAGGTITSSEVEHLMADLNTHLGGFAKVMKG